MCGARSRGAPGDLENLARGKGAGEEVHDGPARHQEAWMLSRPGVGRSAAAGRREGDGPNVSGEQTPLRRRVHDDRRCRQEGPRLDATHRVWPCTAGASENPRPGLRVARVVYRPSGVARSLRSRDAHLGLIARTRNPFSRSSFGLEDAAGTRVRVRPARPRRRSGPENVTLSQCCVVSRVVIAASTSAVVPRWARTPSCDRLVNSTDRRIGLSSTPPTLGGWRTRRRHLAELVTSCSG